MRLLRPVLFLATLAAASAQTSPADLSALLARPILAPAVPLAEVRAHAASRVAVLPTFTDLPSWKTYADRTRRDVLEKIIFRDSTSRAWRDAPARVEWLDSIPGGPGYSIRPLRYEALPGLWIPAVLYVPANISGKIPVHLAVNGHDKDGKAAPYKQLRCINLAKRGIASLNVEWFAQGQLRADGFLHYRMNQLDLCGVSGLAPFYLAMSRALDALLALPYADPTRVAVSGLSGGGWQTITISALDPRVTLSNPVAGYSSFLTRAEFPSDLGDSEQTPTDLATVADYTHYTALLAGRSALLTFNAKDNCCFASDHALSPLLAAAEPAFQLYGQPHRLRSHINVDPGTHNFELDNRQAFYRMVGDTFFPGDPRYRSEEIDSAAELKSAADLTVPLPADNLDFNQLARAAAAPLPRTAKPTREKLTALVHYQPHSVTVTSPPVTETRGDTTATFHALRVGAAFTVPVVALTRGTPRGTTLLVADAGRKSLAARAETLLAAGQRVLAVDPFYFGESKITQRDFLHALLVAATGDRPLGLQTSQLAAVARWARTEFASSPVALESTGPRLGLAALLATVFEPTIATLRQTDTLPSLHEVIRQNWSVDKYPELFCFGLLEHCDIPQLRALVGADRLN